MRWVLVHLLALPLLAAGSAHAAHPNNSIAPEPPPATPYGMSIVRGEEGPLDGGIQFDDSGEDLPVAGMSLLGYLRQLEQAEGQGGPYSTELIEPLADVGRAYQDLNKHSEALDLLRRAMHLMRVNEGLYSPSQIPLLEAMIESQLEMGRLAEVDKTREYLYRVQRNIYDASEEAMLQAATSYSTWKRELYLENLGFENYLNLLDIYNTHDDVADRIAGSDETSAQCF